VVAATVTGASDSPSADLLAAWLAHALKCPVTRVPTAAGTGMTGVRLERRAATSTSCALTAQWRSWPRRVYRSADQPGRRELAECLADELRRLDPDEIYEEALTKGLGKVESQSVTAFDSVVRETAATVWPTRRSPRPPRTCGRKRIVSHGPMVVVHRDKELLASAAAARLVTAIVDAQSSRGQADIVLTGGSMGTALLVSLGRSRPGTPSTGGG
jgi:hypothetical protein